ncbi:hypothetical protein GCWU000182_01177 [Abiotrophia defectiva ATCC 49176]|uniref:Uncharacterized protein n=1 Tax=Abiotrophia defectiva ATCC 49176 TaxID=592010 RepID=W1Q2X6_ABIDE|nr:hypothetical protein GCWU000182_01749 [Abiotrophia defectiva ATCC 49176]ESK65500.1 hypothetical protein GCWU000182_01177 [Abiotrophia defectiva ATCC 49176]
MKKDQLPGPEGVRWLVFVCLPAEARLPGLIKTKGGAKCRDRLQPACGCLPPCLAMAGLSR